MGLVVFLGEGPYTYTAIDLRLSPLWRWPRGSYSRGAGGSGVGRRAGRSATHQNYRAIGCLAGISARPGGKLPLMLALWYKGAMALTS